MNPRIDLLVVSHNNRLQLERLLNTLQHNAHAWEPHRLYVCDNGSTDGTQNWLKARNNWDIRHLWYNDNVGYATAVNMMAAASSSDYLGILNADVWLTQDDVVAMRQVFENYPAIDIAGPKQRDERGNITHAGIFGSHERPMHRGWKEPDPQDARYRDMLPAVTVSGSAYFVRRRVWEELTNCPIYRKLYPDAVGAFLPTPHFFEETWASYHAAGHGHNVFYVGGVSIGHSWHTSSPVGSQNDKFMISKGMFVSACDFHGLVHD